MEFKKYQRVKVASERGTQIEALVLGVLPNGRILVEVEKQAVIVDREDIQS